MQSVKWLSGIIIIVLLAVLIIFVNPASPRTDPNNTDGKYLTIATGSPSGPYFMIGNALAGVYEQHLGYTTSVLSTDGSVDNIELLHSKEVDLSMVMSDLVSSNLAGDDKASSLSDLNAIAGLYLNYVQLITFKDSQIHNVKDLHGKIIGVGAPNSGVEANARTVLAGYGITYQDITPEYLSYSEAIEQLKNKTIEAAFVTSGLPNPAVLELMENNDVRIVPIQLRDFITDVQQYPYFFPAVIPEGTYHNVHPVPTIAIQNILLVRNDLSVADVFLLTQELFENLDVLKQAHVAAESIHIETAWRDLPVPLHPGAKKYYQTYSDLKP